MTDIDTQAPAAAPVSAMTDEELAAAMAGAVGDQDDIPMPPGEDGEDSTEESQEESVQDQIERIKLFDEEYEPDQLKEILSKGKDYTRKTQELADKRKEVEQLAQVTEAWNSGDPAVRKMIVEHLAKEAGISVEAATAATKPDTGQSWDADIEVDELYDGERKVYEAANRKIAALEAKLAQAVPLLDKLNNFVETQTRTTLMDQRATVASAELAQELGIAAPSVESVKAAMQETNNPDPKAAWLLKNAKALMDAGVKQGVKQVVADKPNAPGKSGSRTFDPMAKDADGNYRYTGDEAAQMVARGWKPVEGA